MGWVDSPARSLNERRFAQRTIGVSLVALLHLLLLAALLHSAIHPAAPTAAPEIFLRFLPNTIPAPKQEPKPLAKVAQPPRGGVMPPAVIVPPAIASPPPDLRGIGQSLFGCSPEALATASPEMRGQCLNGLANPKGGEISTPRDHTKDAARWANAIKERNAPPGQIPCTYIAETPVTGGAGGYKVPMVEMVCLRKLLSH